METDMSLARDKPSNVLNSFSFSFSSFLLHSCKQLGERKLHVFELSISPSIFRGSCGWVGSEKNSDNHPSNTR